MKTYRIPVSEAEYERLESLRKRKQLKKSSMIRMLLTEAVSEYKKNGYKSISISLNHTDFVKYDYVQTYVSDDIKDFFCELSKAAGGIAEGQLVRQFLIAELKKEEG